MPLSEDNGTLSAFRQMGYAKSLAKKKDTRGVPETSDSLCRRFFAKLKPKVENSAAVSREDWIRCIPAKFADKCAPQNARLGVLYVSVCSPAIKQELMFSERDILKNVKNIEGCSKIKKIRFV